MVRDVLGTIPKLVQTKVFVAYCPTLAYHGFKWRAINSVKQIMPILNYAKKVLLTTLITYEDKTEIVTVRHRRCGRQTDKKVRKNQKASFAISNFK